ncbi:MAG: hypothetical protein MSH16_00650, partial [Oscillospiraceae bacterium]|nr:hypothetical protein [Oscillospiraceae bacterium]
MKQCKTILLLTLTAALLLTLSACGGSDSQQPPSPTPGSVESPVPDTTTPPSVETEEPVPETTPEATVVPAEPSATPEPVTVADPKATAELVQVTGTLPAGTADAGTPVYVIADGVCYEA